VSGKGKKCDVLKLAGIGGRRDKNGGGGVGESYEAAWLKEDRADKKRTAVYTLP